MVEIEGQQFTLLWDIDRNALAALSFDGRADWLQQRVNEVLLKPISTLEQAYDANLFVWLAITELVCAGIESLGGFFGNGRLSSAGTNFCRFVARFMHGDFSKAAPDARQTDLTYAEHLEKYFRDGLAHGFKIEWGGLWFADDPNCRAGYLRLAPDGKGIAVCPRMLLADFRHAIEAYFKELRREGEASIMGRNFGDRFEAIREHRGQR